MPCTVFWGGLNDVADSLVNDPANAQLHTLAAAAVNVEQIKRLQEAGARHILVYNLPDIAVTPYAAVFPEPARVALSGLNAAYNERLDAGLRDREAGIIPINVWALTGELLETPETYGFTDVTGTACGEPNASSAVAVTCGPEGSGYPVTDKSDDTRRYLFADRSHPSGATHEIIANVVTSTLAAPVQVSLAGEGGVEIAAIHRSAVSNERMTDFRLDRGSWRGYVTGRIGTQKLNALPRLGDTRADVQVLTVGVNHRVGSEWWWGAAVSLGRYDNDASGASLDSTGVLGSLHGTWRRGGLYLSGALSVGKTSVDIKRSIALGSAVRAEQGSTDAGQFGTDLEFGWMLGNSQGLRHGPFLGLAWLDQTIDGYRENGNLSTSMNFSDFTRNSLIARGGYFVGGTMAWDSLTLRPYAGLAYEREFKDDPVSVTAGSNTMPGRFTLSGFMPPREWASTDFGLAVDVHENASAFAGYSGRFGSESRQDHRLNVGLRIAF